MKDGPCFDLLNRLKPVDFKVIFILPYDRPLIRELRCCVLEHLINPVDPEDLAESLKKTGKMNMPELNMQLEVLEENMQTRNRSKKRIILKTPDAMQVVWLPDIVYCESLDKQTCFHLVTGKKILVRNTLNEYDEMLSESGFFRSHKSMLINLTHINRFEKGAGGNIVLTNEYVLPVSSRKRDQLLEMLGRINGKLTSLITLIGTF
jgi:two-component system LytT family response regulator